MPTARASKLQLLIDRNAAAGAIVERSRAQGVVVGTGTDQLRLDYVSGTADVQVGDRVVTSGIDGIYPKGFVIGQIESIQRGAGAFSAIVVRPAVDFSGLESVLVVLTPPPGAAENLEPGPATSGHSRRRGPRSEGRRRPGRDSSGARVANDAGALRGRRHRGVGPGARRRRLCCADHGSGHAGCWPAASPVSSRMRSRPG